MEARILSEDAALAALGDGIRYIHAAAVHGDVAEFGCYLGRTAASLAYAIGQAHAHFSHTEKSHGIGKRTLRLYDSFQGLPEATHPVDAESPHVKSGAWCWQLKGVGAPTPEAMRKHCGRFLPDDQIDVVPGWYRDTLPLIARTTKFALVHIDCDLYESTYQVLDHLFGHDMLTDGCALFFDDWYCNRGSPKFGEQKAWRDVVNKPHPPFTFTDWGAYGPLGRKFIIHKG